MAIRVKVTINTDMKFFFYQYIYLQPIMYDCKKPLTIVPFI